VEEGSIAIGTTAIPEGEFPGNHPWVAPERSQKGVSKVHFFESQGAPISFPMDSDCHA